MIALVQISCIHVLHTFFLLHSTWTYHITDYMFCWVTRSL